MAFSWFLPNTSFADKIVEQTVVTLGADLTQTQRQAIRTEMNVGPDVKQVEVTNAEEHKYPGSYMSKETIGRNAISSAKIVMKDNGQGITVNTKNITHITNAMYANTAITAGIKDADIYITAPFKVSGTAGLTGIIKAFEEATGKKIDANKKQAANEELVRTQELGQELKDPTKAVQFMNRLKEEIAKEKPQTTEEYTTIIVNVSNEFNINLNQQTTNELVQWSQNFSGLNIDWNALSSQFEKLGGDLGNIINAEQTQGIIDTILEWLGSIFGWIGDLFTSSSSRQ
jgi:uncharacterized protein YpuA (DUF1002 family)